MDGLPERKSNRIKEYSYSQNGAYFITICTKDRREILGVIEEPDNDIYNMVSVKLSKTGEIVRGFIENISAVNPAVSVPLYVIMPDHIHLILQIDCESDGGTPPALHACPIVPASPTKEEPGVTFHTADGILESVGKSSRAKMLIPKVINSLKGLSSKKAGSALWQRSYSDHVIRNDADYRRIEEYVLNNPGRRFY